MIKIVPLIVISSTLPIVDYNPKNKYVLDNDYSEFNYIDKNSIDPLTDLIYKTLIKEIERGQHEPIQDGR